MNRAIKFGVGFLAVVLTALPATAAQVSWGGEEGVWKTGDVWRNADGDAVVWTDGDIALLNDAYGDEVAGRVITIQNNVPITTGGIHVTANGYILRPSGTAATPLAGNITISDGITLGIFGDAGTRGLLVDSVSGAGTLNLLSRQDTPTTQRQYVRLNTGADVSTDVVISAVPNHQDLIVADSGRRVGFEVWTGGAYGDATISGNIVNTAQDGAFTMLGARGHSLTVSGVISGTNGVIISSSDSGYGGSGTVALQAQNTYGGDTHLAHALAGVLKLDSGAANTLPTSTRVVWGIPDHWGAATQDGGQLDLNGLDQQVVALVRSTTGNIGGLVNTHASAVSTLTLSGAAGQDGDYAGPITGAINLVKAGDNTQILGGTAAEVTYTGTTTVTGGTLVINGDFSAASGAVTVTGGTLAGNGTIGGATTIAAGGAHNAGNSPGQQTFNSALAYEAGATLVWELVANDSAGAGVTFDHILANGGFSIADAAVIDLVFNLDGSTVDFSDAFWAGGPSWQIIAGAGTGTFDIGSVSTDTLGASLAGSFVVTNEVDGVYLNYVIPEPASFLLLAMGGLAVMGRGRRA